MAFDLPKATIDGCSSLKDGDVLDRLMRMNQHNLVMLELLPFEMVKDMNSSGWVISLKTMMNDQLLNIFNRRLLHLYLHL